MSEKHSKIQTKCAHAPWASYNTPYIELIQYGHRIGKKVYYCSWYLDQIPLLSQAPLPIYMTFYNAKLQEENGQKSIGIDRHETAPEHLFVISQDAVVDYLC